MNESGWRGLARIMPPDAKARFGFSFRRKDYIKDTASATVVETQLLLACLGYDPGDHDGRLKPRTRRAIAAWQSDNRMTENGRMTRRVVRALRRASSCFLPNPRAIYRSLLDIDLSSPIL